jgi:hypothetical protein
MNSDTWLPIVVQVVSVLSTLVGFVVVVTTRIGRLEARIELLATEIRKDREHVEHRIRQLEVGMSQVRAELSRLSYSVGVFNRPHVTQPTEQPNE